MESTTTKVAGWLVSYVDKADGKTYTAGSVPGDKPWKRQKDAERFAANTRGKHWAANVQVVPA